MNAEDSFNHFYETEGIRFFKELNHKSFMRFAYLHGWADSKAKDLEINGGYSVESMKSIANFNASFGRLDGGSKK